MKPLKALIVEDNPVDADLLVMKLERGDYQVESERVDTPQAYSTALDKMRWDIIFCDHTMPKFSSFQAHAIRNERNLDTPFIILSGSMGEELAVEAMRAGATDYFVKGRLTRLAAAIERDLQDAMEREKRRKTEWELERFVASLTHDMRTPILGELRVLELLKCGTWGDLNPEQQEIICALIQSNYFVQHMVNNILFTYQYKQHKVHLNPEPTDMRSFISEWACNPLIQTMLQDKGLQLLVDLVEPLPPLPMVDIDRNEIQRVLLNLFKNAVDYSPPKSIIRIALNRQDNYLRVGVQDMGPGVDPKIEPFLFTLYATSAASKFHHVGLGLGLYLSKQIIDAHCGRIAYQKSNQGSLFYFDLPVKPEEESS